MRYFINYFNEISHYFFTAKLLSEAVKQVIKCCFYEYKLKALTIGHFPINNQSQRVIEKCGFKFIKQVEYYAKQMAETREKMQYVLLN